MKRSAILAGCGVLLLAIGCQQGSNDQSASNTNPPPATDNTAKTPPANTENTSAANNANATSGWPAVQAAFNTNCMPCHSAKVHRSGLDLTSYESSMKGGQHGALVKAGDPDNSLLVQYLTGKKKPQMPMNRAPLGADQLKVVTDWIKAGAKQS